MSTLKKMSERLATKAFQGNEALDPATILTFAEIIAELIAKIQECKAAKAAHQSFKNPGLFERIVLRNTVRDRLGNKAFRTHGQKVVDGLLALGDEVTQAEVEALYNEV